MPHKLESLYDNKNIDEKQTLIQSIGIKLQKYIPSNYILKKLTKNVCYNIGKNKSKKKIKKFIDDTYIDWKLATKCINDKTVDDCVDKFEDLNAFFSRQVDESFTDILKIHKTKPLRITSPAECRSRIVNPIEGDKNGLFLIKKIKYSILELLDKVGLEWINIPKSTIIFRLAPKDYHRLHSPIDCIIHNIYDLGDSYYSVDPLIFESNKKSLQKNIRKVLLVKLKDGTKGALVIIGATCVSSIIMPKLVNDKMKKGDYFSHFKFGGSCLMLILNKQVKWNTKLQERSSDNLETYLQPGNWIGDII